MQEVVGSSPIIRLLLNSKILQVRGFEGVTEASPVFLLTFLPGGFTSLALSTFCFHLKLRLG
jgi:hypothetical protein